MKLALNKIVGRPVVHGTTVVAYEFVEAVRKLSCDPLPIKERYALGRTLEDLQRWVAEYEKARTELIAKHCEPRSEMLRRKLKAVSVEVLEMSGSDLKSPVLHVLMEREKRVAQELAEAEQDGAGGGPLVFKNDESAKALQDGLNALAEQEADFFLDHRIALAGESKLTGAEMSLLLDLIAEPA